jgi:uncharacterized membrane protein YraQ (UPF0718 family)
MEIILKIMTESWHILQESAIFMLFGFFVAGLLKAFLSDDFVAKHLGKGKFSSIIKASALGVPIPLWSCGVVPAAASLRQQGASKGATAAFLISTPETGVDSIAVTYALLDPFMTLLRPLAAFITATISGFCIDWFDIETKDDVPDNSTWKGNNCSCGPGENKKTVRHKFYTGMTYAFNDLLGDIGKWFLAGILIAGLITALIPPQFIETNLGEGFLSMLIMLAVGLPMYVCATASTPIAAALAFKGLSPGAALVFLLAGPATNAASLAVLSNILGKRATLIHISSIAICSLAMGMTTNYVYSMFDLNITEWIDKGTGEHLGMFSAFFAIVLLVLIFKTIFQKYFKSRWSTRQGRLNVNRHYFIGSSGDLCDWTGSLLKVP